MPTDLVSVLLPDVRTALAGVPGGSVRKSTDNSPQPVPSWWLAGLGSGSLNDVQDLDTCELHIWRESRQEMEEALAKVAFLKRHTVDAVTFRRQSVVKVQEDVNVHHATITLEAMVYG